MLMLGERPPRSVDEAIATGERLSAMMIASYLNCHGVRAEAVNAAELIVTDDEFGNASPLLEETREKARARLTPILAAGAIPIVTGFNGATEDGRPTTLGRGGSDFSASILASVLDAEELWIWSDVDGIMTADPRLVPNAAVLDEVTYKEAAELAYNGAKVLHPRTLAPLDREGHPGIKQEQLQPGCSGNAHRTSYEGSAAGTARGHFDGERCARIGRTCETGGEWDGDYGPGARCAGRRGLGSVWRFQAPVIGRIFVS